MTGKKRVIEDRLFSKSIIVAAIVTTLLFASLMTYDYFESTGMASQDMVKQPQEHAVKQNTNATAETNLGDVEEVSNG